MKPFNLLFFFMLFIFTMCKNKEQINPVEINLEETFLVKGEGHTQFASVLVKNKAVYALGYTAESHHAPTKVFLYKTNFFGNKIFQKTINIGDKSKGTKIVSHRNNQSIYIIGTTESNSGATHFFVAQIDTLGNLLQSKVIENSTNQIPGDLDFLNNGKFLYVGTSAYEAFRDVYMATLKSDLTLESSKIYGGHLIDGAVDVLYDLEKNEFFVLCYTMNFNAVDRDNWLIKTNENLDSIWSVNYKGNGYEEPHTLLESPNGNLVIIGHSSSSDVLHDCYVLKVNRKGEKIWDNHFGGTNHEGAEGGVYGKSGKLMIIGRTNSFQSKMQDGYYALIRPDGMLDREETIGFDYDDAIQDVAAFDDFYFMVGNSFDEFGNSSGLWHRVYYQ